MVTYPGLRRLDRGIFSPGMDFFWIRERTELESIPGGYFIERGNHAPGLVGDKSR